MDTARWHSAWLLAADARPECQPHTQKVNRQQCIAGQQEDAHRPCTLAQQITHADAGSDSREQKAEFTDEQRRQQRQTARRWVEKASTRTNLGSLRRLAVKTDGAWRLREDPPLIVRFGRVPDNEQALHAVFEAYRESLRADLRPILQHYAFADAARKVVGVGSVGLRSFMVLLVSPADEDPLFLQFKEARPSVLEPYTEPGWITDQGERVVTGQRFMQAASDQLLAMMEELNRELGTTFVFATHDPRVMERARRLVRLVDGAIASDEQR